MLRLISTAPASTAVNSIMASCRTALRASRAWPWVRARMPEPRPPRSKHPRRRSHDPRRRHPRQKRRSAAYDVPRSADAPDRDAPLLHRRARRTHRTMQQPTFRATVAIAVGRPGAFSASRYTVASASPENLRRRSPSIERQVCTCAIGGSGTGSRPRVMPGEQFTRVRGQARNLEASDRLGVPAKRRSRHPPR